VDPKLTVAGTENPIPAKCEIHLNWYAQLIFTSETDIEVPSSFFTRGAAGTPFCPETVMV